MARAFISLRLKLTLWYLALFAVIQVTLVLATVLLRRDMIKRTFDGQLRQRAEAFVERLVAAPPPWTTENLRSLAAVDPGIALCAVRNRSGEIVAASINRDLRGLPSLDDLGLTGGPTGAVFTTLPTASGRLLTGTEQALRLVTMPFKDRQGNPCILQATTRAELLDRLLGPLLDLFLLGVPIGLVAASIPAWRIARRATAPIHQISAAARQVSPDQSTWGIQLEARDPEVFKLQAELNDALERLETGFRAQEKFVSNVSHELRTPITVLLTESQVLKAGNPTQAECLQYLGSVEDEMRRLGRLVESVLDLVRAGLGRTCMRRELVAVNDLVLRAVRHSGPQARRRHVRLLPELSEAEPEEHEPGLVGDPDLLSTMLENLVRNAIRFSPPGQAVQVTARFRRAHVQLVVRDRGPGIPDEYLDRVFERYVQAPGDASRQGTGLGLAIAREVAMLHGGSISAWNRGHGGCAFGVRLPLRKPAAG